MLLRSHLGQHTGSVGCLVRSTVRPILCFKFREDFTLRLNAKPKDAATLASDLVYQPSREFWSRPDVSLAVKQACLETASWLKTNKTHHKRLDARDEKTGEFYSEIVAPWLHVPEQTDNSVRLKLRLSKLDDKVREQGLIDLFSRRLPRALNELEDVPDFCQLALDAEDWSELLNASAWSVLDETLAAQEAPKAESRLPFVHLKNVYGFRLKTPVTRLVEKVAVRFSRMGLLRVHYEGKYFAAAGSVYSAFYKDVYEPVTAHFETQVKGGK